MTSAPGESHIWFLRNSRMFEDQTESLIESADHRGRTVEFERGDVISVGGPGKGGIFMVLEGQVKLRSLTEGGKEIILDVLAPGDTFGGLERAVEEKSSSGAPDAAHPLTALASEAVALTRGAALRFDVDYFTDLLHRRPALVVNVSRILGMRQKRLELRLARLLYRSSLGKVAGLLAELAERYGTKRPDGVIELSVKLTHQEMASIVGIKRETVSESLAELELRGLITSTRSKLEILKLDELDKLQ